MLTLRSERFFTTGSPTPTPTAVEESRVEMWQHLGPVLALWAAGMGRGSTRREGFARCRRFDSRCRWISELHSEELGSMRRTKLIGS